MFVMPVNIFEGKLKDFQVLASANLKKNLFSPTRRRKLNRFLFGLNFTTLVLVHATAPMGGNCFFMEGLFSFSLFTIFHRLFNFISFSFWGMFNY